MKKTKRILAMLMALALCLAMLAGCGEGDDSNAAGGGEAKTAPVVDINNGAAATIAYIPMSSGQEDYAYIVQGMEEALGLYPNVRLVTYDAGFNPTTQSDLLNECITQGVNAIFINSMDATALNGTIAEAEAQGITVISINNGCSGVHTAHIMNTDYNAGYEAAEYLDGKLDDDANVVILDVNAGLKPTCRMGTGFEDYAAETGHFNVLEDYAQDLTGVEDGYNATSELLAKYDDIDVIYSVNDNGAIGAYQAVVAAGRENDGIIIWGYTGTPAALDAIAQGQIYGTSYTDPYYEGYAAMCLALMCIQGGVTAPSMNNEFFANIVLPTTIVTSDNIMDIIAMTHWDMSDYDY